MLYPISEAVTLQRLILSGIQILILTSILQPVLQPEFINPEWKNLLYSNTPEYAFSAHVQWSWVFSSVTAWEGT